MVDLAHSFSTICPGRLTPLLWARSKAGWDIMAGEYVVEQIVYFTVARKQRERGERAGIRHSYHGHTSGDLFD